MNAFSSTAGKWEWFLFLNISRKYSTKIETHKKLAKQVFFHLMDGKYYSEQKNTLKWVLLRNLFWGVFQKNFSRIKWLIYSGYTAQISINYNPIFKILINIYFLILIIVFFILNGNQLCYRNFTPFKELIYFFLLIFLKSICLFSCLK